MFHYAWMYKRTFGTSCSLWAGKFRRYFVTKPNHCPTSLFHQCSLLVCHLWTVARSSASLHAPCLPSSFATVYWRSYFKVTHMRICNCVLFLSRGNKKVECTKLQLKGSNVPREVKTRDYFLTARLLLQPVYITSWLFIVYSLWASLSSGIHDAANKLLNIWE